MGSARRNASGLWAAIVGLLALLSAASVMAHQGHSHHPARPRQDQPAPQSPTQRTQAALEEIGRDYRAQVEPIFKTKCLQCHGGTPDLPWYYSIPGVKQIIDRDLNESKHHLDLAKGYPFVSHATPLEDLQAIRDTIRDDSMPPFLYLLTHRAHRLTEEEKRTTIGWAEGGIQKLEAASNPGTEGGSQ
ncbi:MAG: heme-binding domain-containing protein [Bdellovibrionales bacterium]|nr:heme-binding domain-containing protein [Bdellovibrionales bacterium]